MNESFLYSLAPIETHGGSSRVEEGGKCALLRERLAFRHTTEVTLDNFGQNSIYAYYDSYERFVLTYPLGLTELMISFDCLTFGYFEISFLEL